MSITNSGTKFNAPFELLLTPIKLPLTLISHSLHFAGERLEAQSEYFATLAGCHTVPEVVEAQSEFIRKAVGDYTNQAGRIVEDVRINMSKAA